VIVTRDQRLAASLPRQITISDGRIVDDTTQAPAVP
jgi:predicted ABC-type transport system involved in lysophospholipase L1 biosynthesis ATPase subunit